MAKKQAQTKSAYQQQLDDPRWQKKRLEVLSSQDFTCQECGSKDKKLNVHHNYYEKGKMPWEYERICYMVLCDECHEKRHKAKTLIDREMSALTNEEMYFLHGILDVSGGSHLKDILTIVYHGPWFEDGEHSLFTFAAKIAEQNHKSWCSGYDAGKKKGNNNGMA